MGMGGPILKKSAHSGRSSQRREQGKGGLPGEGNRRGSAHHPFYGTNVAETEGKILPKKEGSMSKTFSEKMGVQEHGRRKK